MALSRPHQQLGWQIHRLKKLRGMTMEELAHDAEVDASYLSRLERGELNATVDKVFRVAKAFKVAPADLFKA